jgi:hypothetical protein
VQEVGKESRERDTYCVENRPWLQAYPTSGNFLQRLETPEADPQIQVNQKAGREVGVKGGGGRVGGCRS